VVSGKVFLCCPALSPTNNHTTKMDKRIIATRLTKTYKVQFPFVAAGMGFIGSTPALAISVCEAGGIGSIGASPLSPDTVRKLIRDVRKGTTHPFNVNFITLFTTEDHIKVCVEEKVAIVSFHFGHPPKKFIDLLHAEGIKVWEQVGSVDNAKRAVEGRVDLIIAQGQEAGGHNLGTLPTFVLVPQIVEAVKPLMVLAAGGISTGKQVAASLCLGADGVWVGTRLVASEEAFAHPVYKQRLVQEDGANTALTSIFGPEMPNFNPLRVIKNSIVKEFLGREGEVPTDTSNEPIIGKTILDGQEIVLRRFNSFPVVPPTSGDFEQMPFLSGQGVGMVRDIKPAKDIVQSMMDEAISTLSSFQTHITA
jgi:NAD(P)H-dependent flavin oxidoreductase YrpB (nitropropane dioxygenase family)